MQRSIMDKICCSKTPPRVLTLAILVLAIGGLAACERSDERSAEVAPEAPVGVVTQAAEVTATETVSVEGAEPAAGVAEAGDDIFIVKGDVEYGAYLAAECVTCHQADGSDQGLPSITGWDAESFVVVMMSYKDKERESEVMQTIAGRLDEEMIGSLALYFAEQGGPF